MQCVNQEGHRLLHLPLLVVDGILLVCGLAHLADMEWHLRLHLLLLLLLYRVVKLGGSSITPHLTRTVIILSH